MSVFQIGLFPVELGLVSQMVTVDSRSAGSEERIGKRCLTSVGIDVEGDLDVNDDLYTNDVYLWGGGSDVR